MARTAGDSAAALLLTQMRCRLGPLCRLCYRARSWMTWYAGAWPMRVCWWVPRSVGGRLWTLRAVGGCWRTLRWAAVCRYCLGRLREACWVIAVTRACSAQIRITEIAGGAGTGVTAAEAEGCSRRCDRMTERACWRVWRLWRCSWLVVWVECLMN